MRAKWLVLLVALFSIAALAGCGSGGDGGSDVAGDGGATNVEAVGSDSCAACHKGGVSYRFQTYDLWEVSSHANPEGSPSGRDPADGSVCVNCHAQPNIDYATFGNVVGCEGCHGGGAAHNGVGPLPEPSPGPEVCIDCHGLTEIEFHPTGSQRNIIDTHYDDPTTFQTDGDDFLSILEGYIVRTGKNSGCYECHDVHGTDLSINEQWGRSGHAGHILEVKNSAALDSGDVIGTRYNAVLIEEAPAPAGVTFFGEAPAAIHGGWSDSCQRCHTSTGAENYLTDPATYDAANNDFSHFATGQQDGKQDELIYCWACHTNARGALNDPGSIPFPNETSQSLSDGSNVCMACHQGRASGKSIAAVTPTGTETGLGFTNRHYFAAAAIMFGSDATAGYEYAGKTYDGPTAWPGAHGTTLNTCVGCHGREGAADHTFIPDIERCDDCHTGIATFEDIGINFGSDYDGDTTVESFQDEIDSIAADLLTAIQTYATNTINVDIGYLPDEYAYFFDDLDGNGTIEADETGFSNWYRDFDAKLLRAAFNYHSAQDPCSDIHNHRYVIQTLIDSIEDLGGNIASYNRPVAAP